MNVHDAINATGDILALVGAVAAFFAHTRSSRTAQKVADVAKTLDTAVQTLSAQTNNHDTQLTGLGEKVGAAVAKADVLLSSPVAKTLEASLNAKS